VPEDVHNCGSVGNDCTALPNVSTVHCAGGVCVIDTCQTGFGNCDGDVTNGCETNNQKSAAHCGSCGNKCPRKQICRSGTCGSK
jgi:hypothetical protein